MKFVLILIYLFLTISGLVFIKKGGNPGKLTINKKNIGLSMSPVSAIGFICYLCSFLLFTKIVVMFDLSYIMPIVTGIVQIITLIVAKVLFKENLTKKSIIGASLVIFGIFLMNFNV